MKDAAKALRDAITEFNKAGIVKLMPPKPLRWLTEGVKDGWNRAKGRKLLHSTTRIQRQAFRISQAQYKVIKHLRMHPLAFYDARKEGNAFKNKARRQRKARKL